MRKQVTQFFLTIYYGGRIVMLMYDRCHPPCESRNKKCLRTAIWSIKTIKRINDKMINYLRSRLSVSSFIRLVVCSMKKINESFICIHCGKEISQAPKTCRNHCPYCFVSLHVDWKIPWDRDGKCDSLMYPTNYKLSNSEYKILFECSKCHKQHWNKRAEDDQIENLPLLIKNYQEFLQ